MKYERTMTERWNATSRGGPLGVTIAAVLWSLSLGGCDVAPRVPGVESVPPDPDTPLQTVDEVAMVPDLEKPKLAIEMPRPMPMVQPLPVERPPNRCLTASELPAAPEPASSTSALDHTFDGIEGASGSAIAIDPRNHAHLVLGTERGG